METKSKTKKKYDRDEVETVIGYLADEAITELEKRDANTEADADYFTEAFSRFCKNRAPKWMQEDKKLFKAAVVKALARVLDSPVIQRPSGKVQGTTILVVNPS